MKIIDACGLPCPGPVIEAKKAFEEDPGTVVKIIVSDEAARVNVARFAGSRGYSVEELGKDGTYELTLRPAALSERKAQSASLSPDKTGSVFLVTSFGIGTPDEKLGTLLMKTFFQTLPQILPAPGALIFMNGGVRHTVEGAECLELVKCLEGIGIDIVVCGTCLDYFGLKEKLRSGRVSNFFEIASILNTAQNTVRL